MSTDRDKADERYRKAFKAMSELPATASEKERSDAAEAVRAAARAILGHAETSDEEVA